MNLKKWGVATKLDASDDDILEAYLYSTFRSSFHNNPEMFGRFSVHEFQYTYAGDVCEKQGFIKDKNITDKGLEFLNHLQQKRIFKNQEKMNKLLVIATWTLAVGTILLALITLIK